MASVNNPYLRPAASMPIFPATIPAIFQMLDPITQPTPVSVLSERDAITAEPNSGREVPIADAVTPSIVSDIPNTLPTSIRLSTKTLADFITIINDITNATDRISFTIKISEKSLRLIPFKSYDLSKKVELYIKGTLP